MSEEITQEQFIMELLLDEESQGYSYCAERIRDLSLALFLQQRIDRINEGDYITEEQFKKKHKLNKNQGDEK